MTRLSQTALDGDLLTSEQLYRADVGKPVRWTAEQESKLVERARCGDNQVRDEIVLGLVPWVQRYAFRYATTYRWVSAPLEQLDLAQEGSQALLECFGQALHADNPLSYLLGCAYGAIRRYCHRFNTLIVSPEMACPCCPIERLDVPVSGGVVFEGEEKMTLGERVSAPSRVESEVDERPIVQAIDTLVPTVREVMWRWSGLAQTGAETVQEIAGGVHGESSAYKTVYSRWWRGRLVLREKLKGVYPRWYAQSVLEGPKYKAYQEVRINREQRQRLDRAYDALQARGQKVTGVALGKEAGVAHTRVGVYLREREKAGDVAAGVA
ncbi:MAG: RNA polymerase sigma factor [Ktedonobacteraceae bacterium]